MTRILALGDTQLGVSTVTLESQAQVLDRIADVAIEQNADLVLHGGDVFEARGSHGNVVTPEELATFRAFATKINGVGIPILAIRGNHDSATRDVDALDVFHEYEGIVVSQRPNLFDMDDCFVATLPWVSPARLIAAEYGSLPRSEIPVVIPNLLTGIASDLRDKAEEWNERGAAPRPVVLLLHWSISGASLPTGLPVDQLREPVIEWAELDALGFDCVIASHIHKAQRLDDPDLGDATMGFYTGSPQPLNHGESGYEHGVWIIDVEAGACSLDFIEIESPQFVTIEADDVMLANGPWLRPETLDGDIVRVRYTATREQDAAIDKDAIRRELLAAGASRVTIEPQITREVRARVETMTQELGPLEALRMYAAAQGIDPVTNGRMVERLREWIAS